MLIVQDGKWREHIPWACWTASLAVAALTWYAVEASQAGPWPGGSSLVGFVFGVCGGILIVIELLFGLRKRFRSVRIIGWKIPARSIWN